MPPARTARRVATDENAENAVTTRLTRAKTAAITDNTIAGDPPKKAALAKRTTSTTNIGGRKRTALGDVSNVTKNENVLPVDGKKDANGKAGLLAKTTKPTGIQKQPARANSTRTVLGQKPSNAVTSELKRPASGSGLGSRVTKKRNTSTSKSDKLDDEASENVAPSTNGSKQAATLEKTAKAQSVPAVQQSPSSDVEDDVDIYDDVEGGVSLEELIKDAKDLDTEDLGDPLMVAEYVHEIFDYMRQLEISTMPNPNYMDSQKGIEWKMRGILVDWLLEVHTRFKLLPETLFLAVNIIDRFLSCTAIQLDRLQLVGVAAMFIASKYEEVMSPHVQNFVHVADDGFTEAEILSAERFVLTALDYDLSYPNPMNFLRRISKADAYDIQTRTIGKYLLEIGCVDHRFLKHPPSLVAAAAMYLSRLVMNRGEWDATLSKYAGYTEQEITPVVKLMIDYLRAPITHDAFFRKYASKKFLKASIVLRHWAKKSVPSHLDAEDSGDNQSSLF